MTSNQKNRSSAIEELINGDFRHIEETSANPQIVEIRKKKG